MNIKEFFYNEPDGIHYPDVRVGTREILGVDFGRYLTELEGTLESFVWSFEPGITVVETYLDPVNADVALALIEAPTVGSFTITCKGTILRGTRRVILPVVLVLKVT